MWEEALSGYPIKLQLVDDTTRPDLLRTNQLQMTREGWNADYPDPQDFLSVLFLRGSEFNAGNVSLDSANTLMRKADGETDASARLADYQQAEQLLVKSVACIPLWQDQNI